MACFAIKRIILFVSTPALICYDQLISVFIPAVVTLTETVVFGLVTKGDFSYLLCFFFFFFKQKSSQLAFKVLIPMERGVTMLIALPFRSIDVQRIL